MGWKNWPYWLKGGIITTIIYAIYLLIMRILIGVFIPYAGNFTFYIFTDISWFLVIFTGIILDLLAAFLIGVLIGWIVGKIKYKSITPTQQSNKINK